MSMIIDGTNGATFPDTSTQAKAGLVAGGTIATGTVTTLTTTTISDGTNSTSSTNCIQGSAKAWVNFGSTGTIFASYNVSSITYSATGNYTINFTNALADANYAYVCSCIKDNNTISNGFNLQRLSSGTKSTTQLTVQNMVNITVNDNSVIILR